MDTKPSKLDAEVAVKLFKFRWWASIKNRDSKGNQLCVLHASDEYIKKGWVRWNWAPEWYEPLAEDVVWPEGKFTPFVDWYRSTGQDDIYSKTSFNQLPSFSSDWHACGWVIEWLHSNCVWVVNYNLLIATINNQEICHGGWNTLPEGLCQLALKIYNQKRKT